MVLKIKWITLAIVLCSFASTAQKKTVKVKLSYYIPYCGGARPSEEMLAQAKKPHPYSSKKMMIVSEKGKVDSVITDISGCFKIKLAQGKYKVLEPWRYYHRTPNGEPPQKFEEECLKAEWERETATITVVKNKMTYSLKNELSDYCDWTVPCLLEQHVPPAHE